MVIDELKDLAQEKNIKLLKQIDNSCPKMILTDDTRIMQIISNLVSNAIKYTNNSNESIVTIKCYYDNIKHGIKISIIDQGMGIKKEELNNIFKQNGKTSNSHKFNVKSNGIGLYLSQKIANLLDGYISFKSDPKSGSTFSLFHPIKLGYSVNLIKNKKINKILKGNILIVDDDQANVFLFKQLLENICDEYSLELNIDTANDGRSAIEICKTKNFNIIFMDINMPIMDGCTASEIIKNTLNYDGIIIATTGNILAKKENYNSDTNKDQKYKSFDDVIIKPFDEANVLSILNRFLS